MTEISAALGLTQMHRFDRDITRRREIIDHYTTALESDDITFPELGENDQVSGHKCIAVRATNINRATVRQSVEHAGVQLGRGVYEPPLHRQPVFADLGAGDGFPIAETFAAHHICLPLWRTMDDTTVDRVIDVVRQALDGAYR